MPDVNPNSSLKKGRFSIVEPGCIIGSNVTIENFVVISSGSVIGDNCTIRSGAKIGAPPFVLIKKSGKRVRAPQSGVTILENDVEIGYNTVVQGGIESDTIIGENSFINNLCNIGHDIHIGKECTIGLSVSVSGHTRIGDNTIIAPGVTILNRVTIGSNVRIGIGSLVLHDVPSDSTFVGRPAIPLQEYKHERLVMKELMGKDPVSNPIATRRSQKPLGVSRLVRASRAFLSKIRP